MPPPPPPPPAPPPLPKQNLNAGNAHGKSTNCDPPPDRNALLSEIRKGTRLKKAETNDRSAPLVGGNQSSNSAAKRNTDSKSNGPVPLIPPGGLFAQGIPKLRPTVPRSENNSSSPLSAAIQNIKQSNNSSLRVNQVSGSRSQPPSPVSKPKISSVTNRTVNNSESNLNSCISSGNPNFPDDITIKGPAPAPPPQSQKPTFKPSTNRESDVPVKHSTVKRSASQTNLQRPRFTRPPNEKPPPPPKSNPTPPPNAPPPPPSKPPNILRRQSFGVGENHNSRFASNKLSAVNNTAPKPNSKVVGPPPPPPPPRNNSAPNDLNQMNMSSSPGNHLKMNIAPPPPPNRAAATSNRIAPMRPPPPRAPAPPPPPPPPQHQTLVHPAPPSQMKATPASNLAPPPPTRVSSIKQPVSDFEERFKNMFCSSQSLPKPEKFCNIQKSYPSKADRQRQSTRRQPPPPPPGGALNDRSRSHPSIPVQYDSGIYDHS